MSTAKAPAAPSGRICEKMEGKPNMALIYPKSHAECRDSVFEI